MTYQGDVYLTQLDDGSFLAVSIATPRFAVGGPTEEEAVRKARGAIDFYNRAHGAVRRQQPRRTQVITPAFEAVCV